MNKMDETINTYNNIVQEYIEYFNSKDLHGNVQFQKEIDLLIENIEEGGAYFRRWNSNRRLSKIFDRKLQKKF